MEFRLEEHRRRNRKPQTFKKQHLLTLIIGFVAINLSFSKYEEPAKKKIIDESEEIFGDDDVSSDEEAELDVNNSEELIQNEEDRKYLDSLPELDREAILAERFEKLKDAQDMKKAIRDAK